VSDWLAASRQSGNYPNLTALTTERANVRIVGEKSRLRSSTHFHDLLTAPSRRNFWRNPMESRTGQKGFRQSARNMFVFSSRIFEQGWFAGYTF